MGLFVFSGSFNLSWSFSESVAVLSYFVSIFKNPPVSFSLEPNDLLSTCSPSQTVCFKGDNLSELVISRQKAAFTVVFGGGLLVLKKIYIPSPLKVGSLLHAHAAPMPNVHAANFEMVIKRTENYKGSCNWRHRERPSLAPTLHLKWYWHCWAGKRCWMCGEQRPVATLCKWTLSPSCSLTKNPRRSARLRERQFPDESEGYKY